MSNGTKRDGLAPLPPLDWANRAKAVEWFNGLALHVEDLLDLAEDAIRPLSKRELGPVKHREELDELRRVITHALDLARQGLGK